MNVELIVQLGIHGASHSLNPIYLDVASVGTASSWAGSYHILSMGRHYDDYVISGRTVSLPPIDGFPTAHPYERLAGKIRATGVTGNIGEVIAAVFARRYLMAGIGDIAHIRQRRPFRRRKAPDYLMRLGALMPGPLRTVLPNDLSFNWPQWWPVESKARSTCNGATNGRRDALRQLVEYWVLIANSQPQEVGYGLIVTFTYNYPREVIVSLIVPNNQALLIQEIQQNNEDNNDRIRAVRSFLHDC